MSSFREGTRAARGNPDDEIFEIKPVILGGSPTDELNKIALSRDEHIQAVRFWNRVIKERRSLKSV
jgi:hypothetical protein